MITFFLYLKFFFFMYLDKQRVINSSWLYIPGTLFTQHLQDRLSSQTTSFSFSYWNSNSVTLFFRDWYGNGNNTQTQKLSHAYPTREILFLCTSGSQYMVQTWSIGQEDHRLLLFPTVKIGKTYSSLHPSHFYLTKCSICRWYFTLQG